MRTIACASITGCARSRESRRTYESAGVGSTFCGACPSRRRALLCVIAVAQSLRELPGVEAFINQHPGIAQSAPSVDSGFPWWLQLQHFLNMLFMLFIVRAGVQILADHPRLYWGRDCTPGADWFRFQVPVPKDGIWTAKDDSVSLPAWLGIPGLRHTVGLARWWHFSFDLLWLVNGIVFYVLLFATDQWRRLVPLTWEVFPPRSLPRFNMRR